MDSLTSVQTSDQLIPIREHEGQQAVSGRDLHAFLEVTTPYDKWFPRMVAYGFTEGQDFSTILSESTGGRPSKDHALTLDTGKEIAMIQRTEKGKQARRYFIECEKRAKVIIPQFQIPATYSEALRALADEHEGHEQTRAELEAAQPSVKYVERYVSDDDVVTVKAFAQQCGMTEPKMRDLFIQKKVAYKKSIGSRFSQSKQAIVPVYEWAPYSPFIPYFDVRPQHNTPRHHNGQVRTTMYIRQGRALDLAQKLGLEYQDSLMEVAA